MTSTFPTGARTAHTDPLGSTTSARASRPELTTTALRIVLGALALNGFALGPLWVLTPTDTFSQTAALPSFALSQRISWVLLTALVVLAPTLLRPASRPSAGQAPDVEHPAQHRSVPRWTAPLLQVALTAQAATNFVMGFVAPWLAGVAPDTLDVSGGTFQLATTVVWIGFIVVMVVFAVVSWRSGRRRLGALLTALGALAIPGVGPLGSGVMALGLLLTTVSRRP